MSSIRKRPNGRWRARYRDDAGKEFSRHFVRKVDAQRWLDEVTTSLVTGQYVDPRAGRVTFRDHAEQWRAMQVHRPSSQAHIETMLRRHAYPTFGDRPLGAIAPSEVQAWVKGLALAPSTVGVVHSIVSSVFKAGVRDRRIMANPCEGTRLPKKVKVEVVPLSTATVEVIHEVMPDRLKALVVFTAGTGLRQGEVFGLTVDRLDMLRRQVRVDRQLIKVVGSASTFGPPKTEASVRTVPMPAVVVDTMARHLAAYPPGESGLVFTVVDDVAITRQVFGQLWRPVAAAAGLESGTGLHALRHYYASLLIRFGESVKTVQARMGHASAAETLDTYSHLWPDSDDRTRDAVDAVLGAADSLRTATSP